MWQQTKKLEHCPFYENIHSAIIFTGFCFSYRMLWDLRLISFQQRFMSPVRCGLPPLSLQHSVPSFCPSPSTVDWHGTQRHPGHEGRPAAETHREHKRGERYRMDLLYLLFRILILGADEEEIKNVWILSEIKKGS